jgi:hypothetical protein
VEYGAGGVRPGKAPSEAGPSAPLRFEKKELVSLGDKFSFEFPLGINLVLSWGIAARWIS